VTDDIIYCFSVLYVGEILEGGLLGGSILIFECVVVTLLENPCSVVTTLHSVDRVRKEMLCYHSVLVPNTRNS